LIVFTIDEEAMVLNRLAIGFFITAALLLFADVCMGARATVPPGLIGEWCEDGKIDFDTKGYSGHSDGEGFRCDVTKIDEIKEHDHTWKAEFICRGADFDSVEVSSLLYVHIIDGETFLAGTEAPKRARDAKKVSMPPLFLYRRC
jgi:hypothetical protein